MENSDKSRKGVRTRAKRNDTMDASEKTCDSGTSDVSLAPTAHLAEKRKSHELEMCKLRVEWQKEEIDELTKERDCLKEQLVSALKRGDTGSSQAIPLSSDSSSDSSNESSPDTTSDSSSSSSLEEDRKKKRA
ncbi:hypothetical protein Q8A67_006377 [Cirrhinus molitorella]|uniref:Uncharacterized protein n=1 Tax=Cirrhinus molitorella TaxID=172907 RepID=A0AA88Q053_9TELE|nr:hypothetical protein Q8A67_006377 [Cirrhinus molitorella]